MLHPEPLPILWQKRLFDVVAATFLIALTSPLFVLFTVLIVLEHILRGRPFDPLFYCDTRISRGKKFRLCKFNIFDQRVIDKFRKDGVFIHTKHLEWQGQLLWVGKVLRQIYLDELPQLFNVLKGDMSVVGPRPVNLEVFAKMCEQGVPPVALILGGTTGNYQSRKDTKGVSAAALEAEYLAQYKKGGWQIVFTDIRTILRTLKVLLRAEGV
ncbi:MAG: sugar transferase [Candidatus Pacebacteria bacterium]|nr:sugar transferase [Candidatus Paceibacterota bacterium]